MPFELCNQDVINYANSTVDIIGMKDSGKDFALCFDAKCHLFFSVNIC